LPEQSGWQLSQCPLGAFFVVDHDPFMGDVADLIQVFKQMHIPGQAIPSDRASLNSNKRSNYQNLTSIPSPYRRLNMTELPEDSEKLPNILSDPSLLDRTDFDHYFFLDDDEMDKQRLLNIESYAEAKEKGLFTPKPRAWDVDKSLRSIRRHILSANQQSLLTKADLIDLVKSLAVFLRSGNEEHLKAELKKFIYVVMLEKKIAETIDGSALELLAVGLERGIEHLPLSWQLEAEPDDIWAALREIYDDWFPRDEDEEYNLQYSGTGLICKRDVERERLIKEKYPHFYKIMFGDHYQVLPTVAE
jgi:hypothetical protein